MPACVCGFVCAVNPELYALVQRVKAIHAIVGGDYVKRDLKNQHTFDYKKSTVIAHLHNVDEVCVLLAWLGALAWSYTTACARPPSH